MSATNRHKMGNENDECSQRIKSYKNTRHGTPEGTRTPDLLIRSQSLYPAELPTHTFRPEQDVFYHSVMVLSTLFCNYFYSF